MSWMLNKVTGALGYAAGAIEGAAQATAGTVGKASQVTARTVGDIAYGILPNARTGLSAAVGGLGYVVKLGAQEAAGAATEAATDAANLGFQGVAAGAEIVFGSINDKDDLAVSPDDKKVQSDEVLEQILLSPSAATPDLDKTAVIDKQKQLFRDYSRLRILYSVAELIFKFFGAPLPDKCHGDFCKMVSELDEEKGPLKVLMNHIPMNSKAKKAYLISIFWRVNNILNYLNFDANMNDVVDSAYEELSDIITNQEKRIGITHALVKNLTEALKSHETELEAFQYQHAENSYKEHFAPHLNAAAMNDLLQDLSKYLIDNIIKKKTENHGRLITFFINKESCTKNLKNILTSVFQNVFEFLMIEKKEMKDGVETTVTEMKDGVETAVRVVNPEFIQNMNGLVLDALTPKPAENEAPLDADAIKARADALERAAKERAEAVDPQFAKDVNELAQQLLKTTLPTSAHTKTAGSLKKRYLSLKSRKADKRPDRIAAGYLADIGITTLINKKAARIATKEINPDTALLPMFKLLNEMYAPPISDDEKAAIFAEYIPLKNDLKEQLPMILIDIETAETPEEKAKFEKELATKLARLKVLLKKLPHNEQTKKEWEAIYATSQEALNKKVVEKEKQVATYYLGENPGAAAIAAATPVINIVNDKYVKGALATMVDPVMMAIITKVGLSALVTPMQREAAE